jgi:ribosomal protein S18 acetylase RimI-like enzyme
MDIADYPSVRRLWEDNPTIGLSAADSPEGIALFLERNPGGNIVAVDGEAIVGNILCGYDGRRGYIYHLAVAEAFRRNGIGTRLIDLALENLAGHGINKCHLFVFETNESAIEFYRTGDWVERDDLKIFSKDI